jgi:hypothetical protein
MRTIIHVSSTTLEPLFNQLTEILLKCVVIPNNNHDKLDQ